MGGQVRRERHATALRRADVDPAGHHDRPRQRLAHRHGKARRERAPRRALLGDEHPSAEPPHRDPVARHDYQLRAPVAVYVAARHREDLRFVAARFVDARLLEQQRREKRPHLRVDFGARERVARRRRKRVTNAIPRVGHRRVYVDGRAQIPFGDLALDVDEGGRTAGHGARRGKLRGLRVGARTGADLAGNQRREPQCELVPLRERLVADDRRRDDNAGLQRSPEQACRLLCNGVHRARGVRARRQEEESEGQAEERGFHCRSSPDGAGGVAVVVGSVPARNTSSKTSASSG